MVGNNREMLRSFIEPVLMALLSSRSRHPSVKKSTDLAHEFTAIFALERANFELTYGIGTSQISNETGYSRKMMITNSFA
jgi:hypothetical protein